MMNISSFEKNAEHGWARRPSDAKPPLAQELSAPYSSTGERRMDIGGFHIPSIVSASGTFASVYTAFSRFDRIQSRTNRRFVSSWLKGLTAPQHEWDKFFVEIFERFFGPEHWSLRCLKRSIILSLCLMVGGFALSIMAFGYHYSSVQMAEVVTFTIFAVCVTDYLSLWKTRIILTQFDVLRKRITVAGLLLLDYVGTTLLYLACWIPILVLLNKIVAGKNLDAVASLTGFFYGMFHDKFFDPDRIFYFVALLTSAWLWVYVATFQVMRVLSYAPSFVKGLSRIADLDEHPVRTIGFVAAAFSAVVVGMLGAL